MLQNNHHVFFLETTRISFTFFNFLTCCMPSILASLSSWTLEGLVVDKDCNQVDLGEFISNQNNAVFLQKKHTKTSDFIEKSSVTPQMFPGNAYLSLTAPNKHTIYIVMENGTPEGVPDKYPKSAYINFFKKNRFYDLLLLGKLFGKLYKRINNLEFLLPRFYDFTTALKNNDIVFEKHNSGIVMKITEEKLNMYFSYEKNKNGVVVHRFQGTKQRNNSLFYFVIFLVVSCSVIVLLFFRSNGQQKNDLSASLTTR